MRVKQSIRGSIGRRMLSAFAFFFWLTLLRAFLGDR